MTGSDLSLEEMDSQYAAALPNRDLLIGISVLGLPLVGVDGVSVNVSTSGPNWLLGSIGKL